MTDARQALIDAIGAIQGARKGGGGFPPMPMPMPPGGEIDMPIDPDLLEPKSKNNGQKNNPNIEIDDPDHVLDKIKNRNNGNKQDSKEDQEGQSGQNDQEGQTDKEGQDGQDGQKGKKSQKNKNGKNSSDKDGKSDSSIENELGQTISDDYANAWNEIMDRYGDMKSVDRQTIEDLIAQISAGATSI